MSFGDTFEEASISLVCENNNNNDNNKKAIHGKEYLKLGEQMCVCNAFQPQTWRRPFRMAKFGGKREDVKLYDKVFLFLEQCQENFKQVVNNVHQGKPNRTVLEKKAISQRFILVIHIGYKVCLKKFNRITAVNLTTFLQQEYREYKYTQNKQQ